ncbi:hypothetical protein ABZR88_10910 [Mucilaginibacter yixingensis]|nr:hypothetical protein [Mucilaginibacter yixingensis]
MKLKQPYNKQIDLQGTPQYPKQRSRRSMIELEEKDLTQLMEVTESY